MVRYKIKNFKSESSKTLQEQLKSWIESRRHVTIISINTWKDEDLAYSTIIYTQKEYNL